jgi:1-acyl-sn-glycerol-3-phosphate acyltransferase
MRTWVDTGMRVARRTSHTIGFIAYMVVVLIPIPAMLLVCSVIFNSLRSIGRLKAEHSVDFFQYFVQFCVWMLCIDHSFVKNHSLVASCGTIILANHRSWCDFPLDNHLTCATVVSRASVQYGMMLAGALQVFENRVIRFHRGKTNKETLYSRLDKHLQKHPRNILVYPEGSRRRHMALSSVEDAKSTLKSGLLWMIYNKGQYPVQLVISSNKEIALDERAWSMQPGVKIRTYVGTVIHPNAFDSFECFMDAIAKQWLEAWTVVHANEATKNCAISGPLLKE